jgi:hypothetical protein
MLSMCGRVAAPMRDPRMDYCRLAKVQAKLVDYSVEDCEFFLKDVFVLSN